jgi:hypothetical protein
MKEPGHIARGPSSRESMVVTFPSGVRMTMNPPPPIPHENGSVTPSTAAAATAASTAFPPFRRTSMAARVPSRSTVAAAPPLPVAVGCFWTWAAAAWGISSAAARRASVASPVKWRICGGLTRTTIRPCEWRRRRMPM